MANQHDIVIERNGQQIKIKNGNEIGKHYFLNENTGTPQLLISYDGTIRLDTTSPNISLAQYNGYETAMPIVSENHPAVIDAEAVVEWLQSDDMMDLICRIVAGYRKTVYGGNYIGEMSDDARIARDILAEKLMQCEYDLGENSGVWDASEYFDCVYDYYEITADDSDEKIEKLAKEEADFYLEDGIMLTGMDSFLYWLRDEARAKEVAGIRDGEVIFCGDQYDITSEDIGKTAIIQLGDACLGIGDNYEEAVEDVKKWEDDFEESEIYHGNDLIGSTIIVVQICRGDEVKWSN